MWWILPLCIFYGAGWLMYIIVNEPADTFEGALLLVTGILWPVFFLGWLVSRPFS